MPKLKKDWLEDHGCHYVPDEYTDGLGDTLLLSYKLAIAGYGDGRPWIEGGYGAQGPLTLADTIKTRQNLRNKRLYTALDRHFQVLSADDAYSCEGGRCGGVLLSNEDQKYLSEDRGSSEAIGPLCDSCYRDLRCVGRGSDPCPHDASRMDCNGDRLCQACSGCDIADVVAGVTLTADDVAAHLDCCLEWGQRIADMLPSPMTAEQAKAWRDVIALGSDGDGHVWEELGRRLGRQRDRDTRGAFWRAVRVLTRDRSALVLIGAELGLIPHR